MPRHEGTTSGPEKSNNHKAMHSGANGMGLDRRLKKAKQEAGKSTAPPKKKRSREDNHYEPA
jgi:hypothetical protein